MKKLLLVISMLIFAMLMTACGGSSKSVFTEPGAIGKIMGELQNKDGLKGQELKVFRILRLFQEKITAVILFLSISLNQAPKKMSIIMNTATGAGAAHLL